MLQAQHLETSIYLKPQISLPKEFEYWSLFAFLPGDTQCDGPLKTANGGKVKHKCAMKQSPRHESSDFCNRMPAGIFLSHKQLSVSNKNQM